MAVRYELRVPRRPHHGPQPQPGVEASAPDQGDHREPSQVKTAIANVERIAAVMDWA